MKPSIATLHQAYFKERGMICFDNFPFDRKALAQAIEETTQHRLQTTEDPFLAGRDLWRDSPSLQKFLLKKLAILTMDLLDQQGLRLVCDQWIPPSFKAKPPLETLFGFSPLLCVVSIGDTLTFYHPSMPLPLEESYFVLFGSESTRYIKKETDPANRQLMLKKDYAFGDQLKGETHPLIYLK